jgi:hypothetical protein
MSCTDAVSLTVRTLSMRLGHVTLDNVDCDQLLRFIGSVGGSLAHV